MLIAGSITRSNDLTSLSGAQFIFFSFKTLRWGPLFSMERCVSLSALFIPVDSKFSEFRFFDLW